jgi:hypothetical protein
MKCPNVTAKYQGNQLQNSMQSLIFSLPTLPTWGLFCSDRAGKCLRGGVLREEEGSWAQFLVSVARDFANQGWRRLVHKIASSYVLLLLVRDDWQTG